MKEQNFRRDDPLGSPITQKVDLLSATLDDSSRSNRLQVTSSRADEVQKSGGSSPIIGKSDR